MVLYFGQVVLINVIWTKYPKKNLWKETNIIPNFIAWHSNFFERVLVLKLERREEAGAGGGGENFNFNFYHKYHHSN